MERLLKGVSKKAWSEFKTESNKHNMRMGEFLEYVVSEHKKAEKEKGWDFIFSRKASISSKEAESIQKAIEKAFESETGFE